MKQAELADLSIAQMAAWYAQPSVPPAFRGLPARMLAVLEAACGGDWRRCVLDKDGSVTVYNSPTWTPS